MASDTYPRVIVQHTAWPIVARPYRVVIADASVERTPYRLVAACGTANAANRSAARYAADHYLPCTLLVDGPTGLLNTAAALPNVST